MLQIRKKDLAKSVVKEFNPDLQINGMRKAEGGIRASGQIKIACFSENTDKKEYAEYRPLWFWSDKDKLEYKEWRNLRYSDCYEVGGLLGQAVSGVRLIQRQSKNWRLHKSTSHKR